MDVPEFTQLPTEVFGYLFIYKNSAMQEMCQGSSATDGWFCLHSRAGKRCPIWAKRDAEHLSRMAGECSFVLSSVGFHVNLNNPSCPVKDALLDFLDSNKTAISAEATSDIMPSTTHSTCSP